MLQFSNGCSFPQPVHRVLSSSDHRRLFLSISSQVPPFCGGDDLAAVSAVHGRLDGALGSEVEGAVHVVQPVEEPTREMPERHRAKTLKSNDIVICIASTEIRRVTRRLTRHV